MVDSTYNSAKAILFFINSLYAYSEFIANTTLFKQLGQGQQKKEKVVECSKNTFGTFLRETGSLVAGESIMIGYKKGQR